MQNRYFNGYKFHDEASDFTLSLAGMSCFSFEQCEHSYLPCYAAASETIKKIESGAIVNHTSNKKESEDRPVDHYNHRLEKELVSGKSLGHSLALWERINKEVNEIVSAGKIHSVIFNGIGGSYLGPFMMITSQLGDDYNLALSRIGRPNLHFVANTDSDSFAQVIKRCREASSNHKTLTETLMVVISKSGSTAETATNTECFVRILMEETDKIGNNMIAVSIPGSNLWKRSEKENWCNRYPMDEATGGRTSVCSAVAMVPCAFAGLDYSNFIRGMSHMDELTRCEDYKKNPAMLIATAIDLLYRKHNSTRNMILLGYADSLKHYSHYCQQLYMESLGKEYDAAGMPARTGLTVLGGVGTAEQHAFMQQVQKGCADCFVRFIKCRQRKSDNEDAKAGTMGRQLLAFLKGTEAALLANGRDYITQEVADDSLYSIGMLVALDERVVTCLGVFWRINPYDQPGVQDGKLAASAVNALSIELEKAVAELSKKCKCDKFYSTEELIAKLEKEVGFIAPKSVKPDILLWLSDSIFTDMAENGKVSYKGVSLEKKWTENQYYYKLL